MSNIHKIKIQTKKDTIHLAHSSFFEHSIKLTDLRTTKFIDPKNYTINESAIIWLSPNRPEFVLLTYRYLNDPIFNKLSLRDSALISRTPLAENEEEFEKEINILQEENINYAGSITRGMSLGNKQDLILNSALDLQMSGTFGDGIKIAAAFSDQNIPLQPEGNTQQLRDFDKVYVQLEKDQHKLIAGDYEIQSLDSYFTKYYKKFQGASYENNLILNNDLQSNSRASFAIAKGKFNRAVINQIEGNQGPYKLNGTEGENFIFVIAATEKIYIDGFLLTRGIEEDYTIDYNRAEITFTANRLITKDSRIIADFEYNNQDYVRSAFEVSNTLVGEKFSTRIQIYSEQDNKSSSGINDLDVNQKLFLSNQGDDLEGNYFDGIKPVDESTPDNPITYLFKDSIVNEITYDSILVFSVNPDAKLVTAQFSQLGPNQGNYVLSQSFSNGYSYRWVSPVNGIPQGDFEPVIILTGPKLNRLISVANSYKINDALSINSEASWSTKDQNRYAKKDNKDNHGLGLYTKLNYHKKLNEKDLLLNAGMHYEYASQNFSALNPYRATEFERDWNVDPTINTIEHLSKAFIGLNKSDLYKVKYQLNSLIQEANYQGFNHEIEAELNIKSFFFETRTTLLQTNSNNEKSLFLRPYLHSYYTFEKLKSWKIGLEYLQENNNRKTLNNDLKENSFQFESYNFYIANPEENKFHHHFSFGKRTDQSPSSNVLKLATDALNISYKGHLKDQNKSNLNWIFNYRNLDIIDSDIIAETAKKSFLGRLEYKLNLWKGGLQSVTTYELGSGQESRVRYTYIEVEPGLGIYQWIDYNLDSLQQINEFEIAPNPDQAIFVRLSLPTNDYIQTNNVLFNESLTINPKLLFSPKSVIGKTLLKFSSLSNIKINRKTMGDFSNEAWNPFLFKIENNELISSSSLLRNTLFFDRGNPKFDAFVGLYQIQNKSILDIGSESNVTFERFLHYQIKVSDVLRQTTDASFGSKEKNVTFFEAKNYKIEYSNLKPALQILLNKKLKSNIAYNYLRELNVLKEEGEQLKRHSIEASLTYQKEINLSLTGTMTYSKINFDGDQNNPIAFEMLDGLRRGKNYQWNLQANQKLAKNLILSIAYEGRKTGELPVVHLGDIQLKASF